jgi:hypothetical protein
MRQKHESAAENTVFVNVDEIKMPQRSIDRIMRKDHAQIKAMRQDFENGRDVFRVVLRHSEGGGYEVEDGRHRVIAAMLAGVGYIEALIVGR